MNRVDIRSKAPTTYDFTDRVFTTASVDFSVPFTGAHIIYNNCRWITKIKMCKNVQKHSKSETTLLIHSKLITYLKRPSNLILYREVSL